MDSQTREQGGREFREPPPPPPLPHEHDSPLDHNRERAYVRTDNGLNTLTTSPLIHVQEAERKTVVFESAVNAGENAAIPLAEVTELPNPTKDADTVLPDASIARTIERLHRTDIDEIVDPALSTSFADMGVLGGVGVFAFEDKK
jgi:hypothetical protein